VSGRLDLLAGVRVLELGDGVAGAAAASSLWALGAEVTAAIDPTSVHRRGRPAVAGTSLMARVLDRGKHLVEARTAGDLEALAASAGDFDVVLFDRVGGAPPGLAGLEEYLAFVDGHNPGAWVTISAFGLTGERATDTATELTVAAASGPLANVSDPQTGHPLKIAGQQSLLNTGQAAALAACHALDLAGDGPTHLDLSAVEVSISTGPVLEISSVTLNTGVHVGSRRYGAPSGFYACRDGFVRISAMEDHQWQGVVAAMGSPAWAEEFATVASRVDAPERVDAKIEDWTKGLSKSEAESILQAHGVPATGMFAPTEILESPQLAHRGAIEALPIEGDGEARIVGVPFLEVAGDPARPARRRSLRGLRVLEAGHVLAAPLSTALLGAMGATVTKLEDLRRIDMYRRRGPYVDGEPGEDRSAYFAFINHSKGSVAFDVEADRARLAALLDESDVVVENLGSKRALALGIAASVALDEHPDLLALSSSGFGQQGPQAAYRAYAYNLQASCGFCYLTRNDRGESAEIDMAWADLISAFALATAIAAWAVGPSGNRGAGFDYAMADLISAHFNEFIAAASLDPASDAGVDRANELAPFAPHGVYPAEDGWVAIAVDGDEAYEALVRVLDDGGALADPALAGAGARFEQRHRLDGLLAVATAAWPAEKLASVLRAHGVVAEEVIEAVRLVEVPQLVARDFFTAVEHPVWGRRRIVGIPWRPFGGPPIALGAAPMLSS
jgi:crotonobetainyl-CoA:carnitine CoA-transferase CaiB-like acyl-CoA transferase